MSDPSEFVAHLVKMVIPFLPVLFGAVEFIKNKFNLSGAVVEWVSAGIFVLYGIFVILAYVFPGWGAYLVGGFIFLLMCALAPSGFYKFVNERFVKLE